MAKKEVTQGTQSRAERQKRKKKKKKKKKGRYSMPYLYHLHFKSMCGSDTRVMVMVVGIPRGRNRCDIDCAHVRKCSEFFPIYGRVPPCSCLRAETNPSPL